jgi:hypothetical protein
MTNAAGAPATLLQVTEDETLVAVPALRSAFLIVCPVTFVLGTHPFKQRRFPVAIRFARGDEM